MIVYTQTIINVDIFFDRNQKIDKAVRAHTIDTKQYIKVVTA